MLWYVHLLKNYPQFVVIHIVKGLGIVKEREGEGGTNQESGTDIYTPPCLKQMGRGKALYNRGRPVWHSLMT